jgi:hypothetical protein
MQLDARPILKIARYDLAEGFRTGLRRFHFIEIAILRADYARQCAFPARSLVREINEAADPYLAWL